MDTPDESIQAQCLGLLRELRTLRERESIVLEKLVMSMAGSTGGDGGSITTTGADAIAVAKVVNDGGAVTTPTMTMTPTESLLNEAYGVSVKNPEERLPTGILGRVKVSIASDAIHHHTTLLSARPDKLKHILGETAGAGHEPYKTCTSGGDWKYWKVLSRLGDYLWASPGHFPDYIATWELRKHKEHWYHIDDTAYETPFPRPWAGSEAETHVEVPYSLVPTGMRLFALPDAGGIPEAMWEAVYSALGTLFSVPPDTRLQLAFGAEALRQMHATEKHYRYLDRFAGLRAQLAKRDSGLRVCDFSDVGPNLVSASYGFDTMTLSEKEAWDDVPAHRKATWPALNNEAKGFIVPSTLVSMHKNVYGNWKVKTYPRSEIPPRPWYRIISLRGLSDIMGPDGTSDEVDALVDLLVNDTDRAKQTMIKSMFSSHVFCRRYKSSSNMFSTPWETLNITWHRIVHTPPSVDSRATSSFSSWKSGPLHNNEQQHIEQRAFTVLYLPHDTGLITSPPQRSKYWTIVVLTPASSQWIDHYVPLRFSIAIVHIVAHGLKEAADAWDQIHPQFSSLVAESSPILDPRRHDRLMFDDDTFSRSRQYFWAMNSLEIFKAQIEDAILEWTSFWSAAGSTIQRLARDEGADEDLESLLRKVSEHVGRLEARKAQFEAIIARTLTLRDGLFNASAVVESKTSTHLGENIQLLTYVSIFYLPLSFCVAVWSVNETYSRVYLVVVTLLVAATTYLLVANLKSITRLAGFTYGQVRGRIVRSMQKQESWAGMAKRFNGFRPRRESEKPSEWNLLRYAVLKGVVKTWSPVDDVLRRVRSMGRMTWWAKKQKEVESV